VQLVSNTTVIGTRTVQERISRWKHQKNGTCPDVCVGSPHFPGSYVHINGQCNALNFCAPNECVKRLSSSVELWGMSYCQDGSSRK